MSQRPSYYGTVEPVNLRIGTDHRPTSTRHRRLRPLVTPGRGSGVTTPTRPTASKEASRRNRVKGVKKRTSRQPTQPTRPVWREERTATRSGYDRLTLSSRVRGDTHGRQLRHTRPSGNSVSTPSENSRPTTPSHDFVRHVTRPSDTFRGYYHLPLSLTTRLLSYK